MTSTVRFKGVFSFKPLHQLLHFALYFATFEDLCSSYWKNIFLISIKQIMMNTKKFQHEEVFRGFWEPILYRTAPGVASVLAFSVQWPEVFSVKEHFWYFNSHWRCSVKNVFRPGTLSKRYSSTGVSLWNLRNLKEHLQWLFLKFKYLESSHSEAFYLLRIPLTTNKSQEIG